MVPTKSFDRHGPGDCWKGVGGVGVFTERGGADNTKNNIHLSSADILFHGF